MTNNKNQNSVVNLSGAALRNLLLTAVITLISTTSFAAEKLTSAKPESVGMSSERLQRIDDYFQRAVDAKQIAGAVSLVARHGKIVHLSAVGSRYREENIPMTTDSIFYLASMTKPIVSTALMMLFEEGRFRLDDPISDWIPEYKDHQVRVNDGARASNVPEARPITIRHVLTHTSGLTLSPEGMGLTAEQERWVTNNGEGFATLGERIARAAIIPAAFHPGDNWQYGSSTDYVAILVEKISGQSIDQFLRERIFQPLGMNDTFYNIPRDKVDRVAAVYRPTENGESELQRAPAYQEPSTYFAGVAGLNSTASDYIRFAQMINNGGELEGVRLLGRMTVDLMISNHSGDSRQAFQCRRQWGCAAGMASRIKCICRNSGCFDLCWTSRCGKSARKGGTHCIGTSSPGQRSGCLVRPS